MTAIDVCGTGMWLEKIEHEGSDHVRRMWILEACTSPWMTKVQILIRNALREKEI